MFFYLFCIIKHYCMIHYVVTSNSPRREKGNLYVWSLQELLFSKFPITSVSYSPFPSIKVLSYLILFFEKRCC